MTESVGELVRGDLSRFSTQERRVARALLADYPRAGLGTSADFAALSGVSAPTVVRFVRSAGFSGYPAFQAELLRELSERSVSAVSRYESTRAGRADGHWLEQGLTVAGAAIRDSLNTLPTDELERTVDLLADLNKRITVVGGRYSGFIAGYLAFHLEQLRPNVRSGTQHTSIKQADAVDASRNDVFVIYDFRRYQAQTVKRAEALADAKAHIICITDRWLSPVARVAETVLPTSVESSGAFDSQAAAFVLTELLVDATLDRLGDRGIERMRRWEALSGGEVLE